MNHLSPRRIQRRRLRKNREGMTLIEIMIVVIIMAMIAAGVGVLVLPRLEQSRITQTRTDSQALRSAVTLYISEHPGSCPTMEELAEERYIDTNRRTEDAWGNAFSIECEGLDVFVVSPGPDATPGTEDDIDGSSN